MQRVLGTDRRKFLFLCMGVLSLDAVEEFARRFIQLAGMTPARKGRIDRYPFSGRGGAGFTGYFPLMESYLVIDVYTDINETEVLLSTCKPGRINLEALKNFLSCQIGCIREVGTI